MSVGGGGLDRIETTVEAALSRPSISRVAREFAQFLKADLQTQLNALADQGIRDVQPVVRGRRTFEEGGKRYEISGKARQIDEVNQAQLQIRELGEQSAKAFKVTAEEEIRIRGQLQKQAVQSDRERLRSEKETVDFLGNITKRGTNQRKIDSKSAATKMKSFMESGENALKEKNKAQIDLGKEEYMRFMELEKAHKELSKAKKSTFNTELKRSIAENKAFAERQKQTRQEFQQSFVPVQDLERSAQKTRKQLNTEKKQVDARRKKEFKDDFDLAQAQLKFNREQFQSSIVGIDDFEKQAKRFRRDLDRDKMRAKIAGDQAAKAAHLRFQNTALNVAAAGIGIFGTAGFPLLNVGFAAMSGGVVGAGLAAGTTAVGEFARAMNELADNTRDTAKELGFVATNFKMVEARSKAISAFAGFGVAASEAAKQEIQGKTLQSAEGQTRLRFWSDLGAAISTSWKELWLKGITSQDSFLTTLANQRAASTANITPENMQSARRNMMMQMQSGGPGIEHDPYQVWQRIQTAALDSKAQEEARIWREAIKRIDEQMLEELKKLNQRTDPRAGAIGGPSAMGNAFGNAGGAAGAW